MTTAKTTATTRQYKTSRKANDETGQEKTIIKAKTTTKDKKGQDKTQQDKPGTNTKERR